MAEKNAIDAHLRTCNSCTKQQEALLQTYRTLRRLPGIEPSPELSRRIVDSATRVPEVFRVRPLDRAFRLLPAPAAITAVALAGLLLGAILGQFLAERPYRPARTFSAAHSGSALILASVRVFDATPPGSFAEGYLQLARYSPERRYEK